jgi:hypothetical protein
MPMDPLLSDVKRLAGVADSRNPTEQEAKRILRLSKAGKLTAAHLAKLAGVAKSFAVPAEGASAMGQAIANGAGKSQVAAFDVLLELAVPPAEGTIDSELRRQLLEAAERMNDKNNAFWLLLGQFGMSCLALLGAVAVGALAWSSRPPEEE